MIKAKSHGKWPSRGLSRGTPDPHRQAYLGMRERGGGGGQHASKHTEPHLGLIVKNTGRAASIVAAPVGEVQGRTARLLADKPCQQWFDNPLLA